MSDKQGWARPNFAFKTAARCLECGDTGAMIVLLRENPFAEFTFVCPCEAGSASKVPGIPRWEDARQALYYRIPLEDLRSKSMSTIMREFKGG